MKHFWKSEALSKKSKVAEDKRRKFITNVVQDKGKIMQAGLDSLFGRSEDSSLADANLTCANRDQPR